MENVPNSSLYGLLLAGGRSSRMGTEKANLIHPDGRTLARKTYDLLRTAGCDRVVLSLRENQAIPLELVDLAATAQLQIVRDLAGQELGPMAGIVAAMQLRPEVNWLVVACDLPNLNTAVLVDLQIAMTADERFIAYESVSDGLPEPLCAIYSAALLPELEQALAAGQRSLRQFLLAGGCRLLPLPSSQVLQNANTAEEWAQVVAAATTPEWQAELQAIWISEGNNFKGRHEQGRLHHPILNVTEVECVAAMGLRGDRYFSYKENFKGQVTFFDAAVVTAVRERFQQAELCSSVFRRNLVVSGIDLSAWIGRRFRFQGIEFEGAEECKPCYWMDKVVGEGAEDFLKQDARGGLRARIISSGWLRQSRARQA